MAGNTAVPSSVNHTNFIVNNIDLESIKLLNDQADLIYDGTRIKWQHDLRSLKNFVENVAGLIGKWKSPGCTARQFRDSNFDFVMTWYPGKHNSLIFPGKEGELLKKLLLDILQTITADQAGTVTDENISLEDVQLLRDCTEGGQSLLDSKNCNCKLNSKALRDIKSEVASLQRQMESTNTIIDFINAIIESMGAILIPSSSENGRIPYDVRLETFLGEFSVILKEKNMIITALQEKLTKVESERDSLKLASQNLAYNISAKPAVNENIKQANYHSYENANFEIATQGVGDLNKDNNSQTDSIRDEFPMPTTWYEPSNLDSAVADAPAQAKQVHPINSEKILLGYSNYETDLLPSFADRPKIGQIT